MSEKENKQVKKWKCTLCGFIYPLPELPEDYVCPICGAGKEAFEPEEE